MTTPKKIKINISEDIGSVSALLLLPENAVALLVLSHGAGANMEHTFMEMLAAELAARGIGTLRFNFPYMEKGGGAPDRPPKAHATIKAAVLKARELAPALPLLAGGKSFGGRMTSQLAATGDLPKIKGIVYYGFPLHPAGKPGTDRAAHLASVTIPQLFLQGTRDTLANLELIREVCAALPLTQLVIIESGDHSFKTLKSSGLSHEAAIAKLAEATSAFAGSLV